MSPVVAALLALAFGGPAARRSIARQSPPISRARASSVVPERPTRSEARPVNAAVMAPQSLTSGAGTIVPAADAAAVPEQSPESFQWTKQWYPIAVVDQLDPEEPVGLEVLGKRVVVWNDGAVPGADATATRKERGRKKRALGTWRVFEDACPHRKAPLSEGRVEENGELFCAYHGWRFDGAGGCTAIPQSPAHKAAAHMANPKASCNAFPTTVVDGVLWVWPESGSRAIVEAAAAPGPPQPPEITDPALAGRVKTCAWSTRDLPYGWDYFMENVHDPAHVPVSHHNIAGNRYRDPVPVEMELMRPMETQGGYMMRVSRVQVSDDSHGATSDTFDFRPPSYMQITNNFRGGGKLVLCLYATPSSPGRTLHIGRQLLVSDEAGKLPPGLGFYALPMPKWLMHITATLFLHQDAVFLHHQEKILAQHGYEAQAGGGDYAQQVYTPNQMDKAVITFRQWLAKRAGGGVPWSGSPALPPVEKSRSMLFDVWDAHVKNCRYCKAALKNVKRAQAVSFAAAALIAVARPALRLSVPWGTAVAAMAAVVGLLLKRFEQLFYTYDFSHAHNH